MKLLLFKKIKTNDGSFKIKVQAKIVLQFSNKRNSDSFEILMIQANSSEILSGTL